MIRSLLLVSCLCLTAWPLEAQAPAAVSAIPMRTYRDSEVIGYHMTATNQSRNGTLKYEADATGRVEHDSVGHAIESFEWARLVVDNAATDLAAGTPAVMQRIGFAPGFVVLPDIAHADPRLTGPVLDLFTFYVDLWLAVRSAKIQHVGDTARVAGHGANSWADGTHVIFASDAVDFVVKLASIDAAAHTARILVRHVPPDSARVTMPADWMRTPVADTPNNWAQIERDGDKYVAGVGRETFDVWLTVNLANGAILSATMDNPVDVAERTCTDRALQHCGEPVHYQIRRNIAIDRTTRGN